MRQEWFSGTEESRKWFLRGVVYGAGQIQTRRYITVCEAVGPKFDRDNIPRDFVISTMTELVELLIGLDIMPAEGQRTVDDMNKMYAAYEAAAKSGS